MEKLFRVAPRDEWSDKSSVSSCEACSKSFTFLTKPMHCCACGRLMCQSCLERQLTLPGHPGTAPVPVCHGCAVIISKAQMEAENAYQQQQSIIEVLNAQRAETERLIELSSSLRSENEHLVQLTEKLQDEGTELRLKNRALEIAVESKTAAKNIEPVTTTQTIAPSSDKVSLVTSTENELPSLSSSSHQCVGNEAFKLADDLRKKETLLGVREATLQKALKKVSSDSDRLAGQWQQLHEAERRMRGELVRRFEEAIEEESRRLQDVHLEELTNIGNEFAQWLELARGSLQEEREKEGQKVMEKAYADAQQTIIALRTQISECERELVGAREAHSASETKLRQRLDEDMSALQMAAASRERQMANELDALRRTLEEERVHFKEQLKQQVEEHKQEEEQHGTCVSSVCEDDGVVEKLRLELTNALRLAQDFEQQANQSGLEVVALKRAAEALESETAELRARLARTEKALVRANSIERRLVREIHEKNSHQSCSFADSHKTGDNSCNNNEISSETRSFVKFAGDALLCAGAYADACAELIGEAMVQRFDKGADALATEWAKRHELTRRNTLAIEETTASIKSFQNDLKARKEAVVRVEEGLRARERELSGRSARLVKLSRALQTVARRMREYGAAAECEEADEEVQIDLGMNYQETEERQPGMDAEE